MNHIICLKQERDPETRSRKQYYCAEKQTINYCKLGTERGQILTGNDRKLSCGDGQSKVKSTETHSSTESTRRQPQE